MNKLSSLGTSIFAPALIASLALVGCATRADHDREPAPAPVSSGPATSTQPLAAVEVPDSADRRLDDLAEQRPGVAAEAEVDAPGADADGSNLGVVSVLQGGRAASSKAQEQAARGTARHLEESLASARSAAPMHSQIARRHLPQLSYHLPSPAYPPQLPPLQWNAEQYDHIEETGFRDVARRPLSTFSVDVDTASYSNVRRMLGDGILPTAGAVRIEELINYFDYDYAEATDGRPFSVTTELASAPWNEEHHLLLVGLRGRRAQADRTVPRNLVFLIDVSGSMNSPDKLPLVKNGLRQLARQLGREDHVSIVVYAGASGLVLPPTSGLDAEAIDHALARLHAGGSTNGADGIRLAYRTARTHFDPNAINRVILATDGDFNVGTTSRDELVRLIERERESGVYLTVLGVGRGNLKDSTMEQLADHGNGNYAYLDTVAEARKVLVEEAGSTLVTIAKDVKVQIEFNPSVVSAYRLIGYENRRLADRDFNDDTKDAGEIGAGHTVTALYEVVPVGAAKQVPGIDPLRYGSRREPAPVDPAASAHRDRLANELATVKLRYKVADAGRAADASELLTTTVAVEHCEIDAASSNLRFAASVAAFGMTLIDSEHRGGATLAMAASLAKGALGEDPHAYRAEFLRLVAVAEGLAPRARLE